MQIKNETTLDSLGYSKRQSTVAMSSTKAKSRSVQCSSRGCMDIIFPRRIELPGPYKGVIDYKSWQYRSGIPISRSYNPQPSQSIQMLPTMVAYYDSNSRSNRSCSLNSFRESICSDDNAADGLIEPLDNQKWIRSITNATTPQRRNERI